MKMILADAHRIVDLCRRVRQTTSENDRLKLTAAVIREWRKVSEPLLFAAEDAVYFGMFGQEREGATPLAHLPALAEADADVYVLLEDRESGPHAES